MPSFEPDEVAEAIAQSVADPEAKELNARIEALAAAGSASPQATSELTWLRQLRIARVSQLLEDDVLPDPPAEEQRST